MQDFRLRLFFFARSVCKLIKNPWVWGVIVPPNNNDRCCSHVLEYNCDISVIFEKTNAVLYLCQFETTEVHEALNNDVSYFP